MSDTTRTLKRISLWTGAGINVCSCTVPPIWQHQAPVMSCAEPPSRCVIKSVHVSANMDISAVGCHGISVRVIL